MAIFDPSVGDSIKYMLPTTRAIQTGIVAGITHPDYNVKIYEILPREIYFSKEGTQLIKVFRTQKELEIYNT